MAISDVGVVVLDERHEVASQHEEVGGVHLLRAVVAAFHRPLVDIDPTQLAVTPLSTGDLSRVHGNMSRERSSIDDGC